MQPVRPEDLPAWMRPRPRYIDWGLLIVLGFCLLSAWPFIANKDVPGNTDAELYVYRSAEVARLVRAGIPFSRWAAYFNYGYGSPIFNYLPPLPHYLAGYYQALTDASPEISIKLLFIASIFAAGSGMYVFVRRRWNAAAAALASVVYVCSPPLILVLPYVLGDLALLMALGLLPWALWAIDKLWQQPTKGQFCLAIVLLTALILTDTRMLYASAAVILLVMVTGTRLASPGAGRYVILAALISIGISAFFWLPATAERDQVYWQSADSDPRAGAISLTESTDPLPFYNLQIVNLQIYRGVGVGTWMVALAGIAGIGVRIARKERPTDVIALLVVGLGFIVLATRRFEIAWPSSSDFMPMLPYHGILIAVFCLSVVSGQAVYLRDLIRPILSRVGIAYRRVEPIVSGAVVTLLCFIPIYAALPAFHLPDWQPIDTSAPSGLQAELHGYDLATLRDGILLPTHPDGSVPSLPAPQSSLIEGLEAPTPVFNRFDPVIHPNHTKDSLENNLLSDHYVFGTNESLIAKLFILNYPNWTVTINGEAQPIITSPEGLVTVNIPNSTVDIRLSFDSTLVRYVAWAITAFGLLLIIAVLWRGWWPPYRDDSVAPALLSRTDAIALMIAFVIFAIPAAYLRLDAQIFQLGTPQALTDINPLDVQFGNVALAGYDVTADTVQPGKDATIRLYWKADKPLSENEQSEIQLINTSNSQDVITLDHRHPGGVPTSRWPADQKSYVEDDFVFSFAPDAPASTYSVQVSLGACQSSPILPCEGVADAQSSVVIPGLTIKVEGP